MTSSADLKGQTTHGSPFLSVRYDRGLHNFENAAMAVVDNG